MRGQVEERMEVATHRPLAAIADLLEARFGIAVNYEDPQYGLDDLEGSVPRKGRLRIDLPAGKGMDGLAAALREAVASYEAAKLPGKFHVERAADSFAISPLGGSVLDFQPTVMFGKRPLIEHLAEILRQAGGARISVGSGPFVPPYPVEFGVTGVAAQVAVARLMGMVGSRRWSYRLLYDYKMRGYMINLQAVAA